MMLSTLIVICLVCFTAPNNGGTTGTLGILVYINPVNHGSGLDRSKLVFQRLATSILLAVHHVNTRNGTVVGDATINMLPPGFQLKYKIADTHATQTDAVKALLTWQSEEGNPALACQSATSVANDTQPRSARYAAKPADKIDAIVGPFRSEESAAVCNLAAALGLSSLPITSYASTSSDLADKLRFPTFSRTTPDFRLEAEGLVRLLTDLGWRRVALLYVDDPWGGNFAADLLARAADAGVAVIAAQRFADRNPAAVRAAVRAAARAGARVFVYLEDTGSNLEAALLAARDEVRSRTIRAVHIDARIYEPEIKTTLPTPRDALQATVLVDRDEMSSRITNPKGLAAQLNLEAGDRSHNPARDRAILSEIAISPAVPA